MSKSAIPEDYFIEATPAHNKTIASLMAPESVRTDIPPVPDDEVILPGGLLRPTGELSRMAIVRELTGAHEEAIVRARTSGNVIRVLRALVESGTATIGGRVPERDELDDLLVGDWFALILGIRCTTYGETIDLESVQCPHCAELFDITINLREIPVTTLADPILDREFQVSLRKGRSARMKLPTGRDQQAIWDRPNLSSAERYTVILSHCVLEIVNADGTKIDVSANPAVVRDGLSIPDRQTLLNELDKHQSGPRFEELSFEHPPCGKEVAFPLEIADMFRGV